MSNLRTLLFYPALAPYRIDLFNRLAKELDFKVVFLHNKVPYHPELDQNCLKNVLQCNYDILKSSVGVKNRSLHLGLWREINRFQPDVTITVEYSFATMSTLLYRKSIDRKNMGFTILTTDNPCILSARKCLRKLASHLGNHSADSILVYTDQIRETLAKLSVPAEKIFVCANHQEEKSFSNKLDKARNLTGKTIRIHGLAGKHILLFVGRLAQEKGADRVIRAFAQAMRNSMNCVFVLVGSGTEKTMLQKLANKEGIGDRVLFLGHLKGNELHVWYLLAGAVILCSDFDPYGAVVNEALLAGIPVLCSSYAGAHVLIKESKNGYVFHPYDIETLTSLINKILTKAPTVDVAAITHRPNLMPIPFERDVEGFINAAHYAAAKNR